MSSEPPFDHPQDHTRYGDPPPAPPRPAPPWYLTPRFKLGCAGMLMFLTLQCCLFLSIWGSHNQVIDHTDKKFKALNERIDELQKKQDGAEKKDK
jgi:hypothetical protein